MCAVSQRRIRAILIHLHGAVDCKVLKPSKNIHTTKSMRFIFSSRTVSRTDLDKLAGTSPTSPIYPPEKVPIEISWLISLPKGGYQSTSVPLVREGKLKIETSPVRCIGHDAFEAPYLRAPLNKRTLASSVSLSSIISVSVPRLVPRRNRGKPRH